ncbi:MAG: hypothetical protein JW942_06835 [Opitutales bacterium]|nr:hypothetical protein [Opitutales bacterium]
MNPEIPNNISLREWYAGMAMHAMLNNPNTVGQVAAPEVAQGSVIIADALVSAIRPQAKSQSEPQSEDE